MEEAAKFLFVGAAVVALFTFLTVSHWITTRAGERRDRERMALLRKVAEQPPQTAGLMRELLQEEDARREKRAARKARQARREALQGGAVLLATGVGLSIFLAVVARGKGVWTIGIMIVLIGVVVSLFAYFDEPPESRQGLTNV